MAAAVFAIRQRQPSRVVVAAPVGAASTVAELRGAADEVVCVETPASFFAVGQWYVHFDQTTDEQVRALLSQEPPYLIGSSRALVSVPSGGLNLDGHLTVPENACGIVLFAHGAGSSRNSPRNQAVARVLNEAAFATLLMDLLTEEEDLTAELRFNIELLAGRLMDATDWLMLQPSTRQLEIGYFGASTGAAAALVAAAWRPDHVSAVVSRGGRPDLAGSALSLVQAPTLLIVGGADSVVLDMNRKAFDQLRVDKRLEVVPGATHLFEEPGAIERVADLAREWFDEHVGVAVAHSARPSTRTRRTSTPLSDGG